MLVGVSVPVVWSPVGVSVSVGVSTCWGLRMCVVLLGV